MATMYRDRELDEQLEASRIRDRRKMTLLMALIVFVALSTIVADFGDAMGGLISAKGRVAVGILGVMAAVIAYRNSALGWKMARVWAIAQIPVFAWSPDGSATVQAVQIPLTLTSSSTVNGVLVDYMALGINLVGVIFELWLRWWRDLFGA